MVVGLTLATIPLLVMMVIIDEWPIWFTPLGVILGLATFVLRAYLAEGGVSKNGRGDDRGQGQS
jgi:hypothetical protein